MAAKQKKFESEINRYRRVGFSKQMMSTHFVLPGKTGAGKTEGIRSVSDDVLRLGGGLLMNDGKADENMYREFMNQATRAQRETSCYLLNFLKPEKMAETNTFSPLSIMHPIKIVEFFGNLIGGGGDGNAQYFFNKGKAMLFPVVNATYIRNKFFNEGFSSDKIFDNTTVINISLLQISMYCISREINDLIKKNRRLSSMINGISILSSDDNFDEIEKLIEYITQNPTKRHIVEEEIDIKYTDIKEIYSNSFLLLKSYMGKVWNQYDPFLNILSKVMYEIVHFDGKTFFLDGIDSKEIKKYYNGYK